MNFQGATGSRPPGWKGRKPDSTTPAVHNLWKVSVFIVNSRRVPRDIPFSNSDHSWRPMGINIQKQVCYGQLLGGPVWTNNRYWWVEGCVSLCPFNLSGQSPGQWITSLLSDVFRWGWGITAVHASVVFSYRENRRLSHREITHGTEVWVTT